MQILIANEQALLRDSLRALVEDRGHEVVAEAADASEAVGLACKHEPDVTLLGLGASPAAAMAAVRRISQEVPSTAVVVLADRGRCDDLLEAVRQGARGFLTGDLRGPSFCEMLERAAAGELVVTPPLILRALQEYTSGVEGHRHADSATALTRREWEVLSWMVRGRTSNRELSRALGLSQNTVRFHVRNILEKLQLHTRAAAVAHALTQGMVRLGEEE